MILASYLLLEPSDQIHTDLKTDDMILISDFLNLKTTYKDVQESQRAVIASRRLLGFY